MRPGADVLADVAAEDPALQIRPDRLWQFGFAQFDSAVRNASRGVELIRLDDSLRRAGVNAGPALAAMIRFNERVVIEFYRKQQFPQKDPRAELFSDQVRVFADPS